MLREVKRVPRTRRPAGLDERRQEHAVNSGEARTAGLPTQDRQLVSQDQDLQLLRATRAGEERHEREQVTEGEIDKRLEHVRASQS